ncbi:MAG: hypothetical protein ACTSO7_07190 [Candidatus Heimdallarchaeota archaeon]
MSFLLRRSKKKSSQEDKGPQIPKIFTKRFKKIHDPFYSLFDVEYNQFKTMKKILWVFFGIGIVCFPLGLVFLIRGSIALGVPFITFGGLFIMMLMYLPIHLIDRKKYKVLLPLKEKENINELLVLSQKYSISNSYTDQEIAKLATYLLVDLKSRDIAVILKDRILQSNTSQAKLLLRAFHLLALKLGYEDHIALYKILVGGAKSIKQPSKEEYKFDREVVVPITKVYFLDAAPPEAKCMISGLKIDFRKETIVTCPFCNAWAKKDLLIGWLKEKEQCPVCSRKLTIDDCPEVRIQ